MPNALCFPAQSSAEDALHAGLYVGWPWRSSRLGGDGFRSSFFSSCATRRRGKPRRSVLEGGASRRFTAFLERSRFRLRSGFLRSSFLPPKNPCAPCSSVAVILALLGGVRGAGGLRLRAALRRDIATVASEQHPPPMLGTISKPWKNSRFPFPMVGNLPRHSCVKLLFPCSAFTHLQNQIKFDNDG